MFYLPYTLATKNVLRFNKVLPSNQENDNLFTPRPLFNGIIFLTACDDDFILKCEWIHISDGSMRNVYRSKTKVHHASWQFDTTYIIMCTQKKKLFEFLKYNNIVTVCVFVCHMFSYHPFYFDFHSARIIFDVSSGFYFWNVNRTPTWHLSNLFKVAFKDVSTKNSEPTYWTILLVMLNIYFIYKVAGKKL